ncbi:MAG: ATP-dependent protease LonB [Candidatus Micrarchaeota archaeon]|nr:ATP-dependent protease LonB [Candidatus Micrarchaeota archaeon]
MSSEKHNQPATNVSSSNQQSNKNPYLDFDVNKIKSTAELRVPERLIDQVIGQDKAVETIKKAAAQRRNVLLVGEPGTGKSMLAQAMAELMPKQDLEDVLIYPNENDENTPLVRVVPTYPTKEQIEKDEELREVYKEKNMAEIKRMAQNEEMVRKGFYVDSAKMKGSVGCGRLLVEYYKKKKNLIENQQLMASRERSNNNRKKGISPLLLAVILLGVFLIILGIINQYSSNTASDTGTNDQQKRKSDLDLPMIALIGISLISLFILLGLLALIYFAFTSLMRRPLLPSTSDVTIPKLIVDNSGRLTAPFIDGTAAKAGALLGDVKHDPLQSGGLGTPPHLRVEAGCIHRAHKGVLFIDEIGSLKIEWQQALLTAMQEKKFSITGQSELSSGALVKTDPVPCDFVLVAAGNLDSLNHMHPALRSRIRGSGYEVIVNDKMDDNEENVKKIVLFIAQEVNKDNRVPHFDRSAIEEIIHEARKMSGQKGKLTLRLRELGGLVRAAGDIAVNENKNIVTREHVLKAKAIATTLEHQLAKKYTDLRKEYSVFLNSGSAIGRVNGLAVLGGSAGIITPIVAEVTFASSKNEGKVIATGKLGEIARESVQNVSAIIKKHLGKDTADYDIHIQFLQTYEGVEGDSASISIAVAIISALEEIPVKQEFAMTGSLSVRGDILPVGGVTPKTEAAVEAGVNYVIVPESNLKDILLDNETQKKIKIYTARTIIDVLKLVLVDGDKKEKLLKKLKSEIHT